MASVTMNTVEAWRHTHGFSVLCTQGELGEWFTLIPGSPQRARDLQRRGVPAGATLTWSDVRWQLERLGLADAEIDQAVDDARRSATTITVQASRFSIFRRLFG
jgi:hypothetical protein